jgi:hypothetical protein
MEISIETKEDPKDGYTKYNIVFSDYGGLVKMRLDNKESVFIKKDELQKMLNCFDGKGQ